MPLNTSPSKQDPDSYHESQEGLKRWSDPLRLSFLNHSLNIDTPSSLTSTPDVDQKKEGKVEESTIRSEDMTHFSFFFNKVLKAKDGEIKAAELMLLEQLIQERRAAYDAQSCAYKEMDKQRNFGGDNPPLLTGEQLASFAKLSNYENNKKPAWIQDKLLRLKTETLRTLKKIIPPVLTVGILSSVTGMVYLYVYIVTHLELVPVPSELVYMVTTCIFIACFIGAVRVSNWVEDQKSSVEAELSKRKLMPSWLMKKKRLLNQSSNLNHLDQ